MNDKYHHYFYRKGPNDEPNEHLHIHRAVHEKLVNRLEENKKIKKKKLKLKNWREKKWGLGLGIAF